MRNSGKRHRMRLYRYTVIFEPAEEGGYVVRVPALNNLATQGETLVEAREMAREAIEGYLECLRDKGIDVPVEETPTENESIREVMEVSIM